MRVSVLTFSRDDADAVIGLIKEMHPFVDDIVLVDSSGDAAANKIERQKKVLKLGKLRIFRALALGMADPLFMYGKNKCNGDWVFLLGSDERPNALFKRDIRKIVESAKVDAFSVEEREGKLSTLQIRLFRKSKASFKGLVHEQPRINGKVSRLDGKYFIDHRRWLGRNSYTEYVKIDKFERYTYGQFNLKMSEYMFKMSLREGDESFAIRLMKLYQKIGGKNAEQELSNQDYFIWHLTRELTYALKEKSFTKLIAVLPMVHGWNKQIKAWRRDPDSKEVFEISKLIHRIGIIKYLDLDNEATVRRLTAKYAGKKQGIGLLMELLKDKYEGKYLK